MRIDREIIQGCVIRQFEQGKILIDDTWYHQNLLITPQKQIKPLPLPHVEALSVQEIKEIIEFKPELVLIGTGFKQFFLPDSLSHLLYQQHIGLECMPSLAACRTYNILHADQKFFAFIIFLAN